ncbi:MAG: DinB family protein [Pyrinomonadaceae bacterium]
MALQAARSSANIVERFAEHQRELISLVRSIADADLRRTVITSPASRFVIYNLLDSYEIILVHEKRHIEQAQRLRAASNFPEAAQG